MVVVFVVVVLLLLASKPPPAPDRPSARYVHIPLMEVMHALIGPLLSHIKNMAFLQALALVQMLQFAAGCWVVWRLKLLSVARFTSPCVLPLVQSVIEVKLT